MTWNYRVVASEVDGEQEHSIRAIFYDNEEHMGSGANFSTNSDEKIKAMTSEPASPWGETLDELRWDMAAMIKAFNEPILIESELDALFAAQHTEGVHHSSNSHDPREAHITHSHDEI